MKTLLLYESWKSIIPCHNIISCGLNQFNHPDEEMLFTKCCC